MADEVQVGNAASERLYTPAPGELQLTSRALVAGCLIGAVIATINMFFGLKTGWNVGGSILAAILSYATFAVLRPARPFTVLETNIAQTAASSTGLMTMAAGLVAPIPALRLMGTELAWHELMIWAASVAFIGVFFAVPLRRQMVLVERLRFPSGTATGHTIVAMYGSGAEALRRARTLLVWAAVSAAVVLLMWAVEPLKQPPLHTWIGGLFVPLSTFGFQLYLDPMLIGAGILVGMRVSLSLAAGAIVAWGLLAPFVQSQGWAPGPVMSYANGPRGWILWTGVAIMLAEALTSLALSWRTIVAVFRPYGGSGSMPGGAGEDLAEPFREGPPGTRRGSPADDPAEAIPSSWWMGGLGLSTLAACLVLAWIFGIPWWMTVIAIGLSWVLAAIAVRSSGETDINPVSGVAKVTQLVFGAVAPGKVGTNLMAGAVTAAGASQAADMMGDLKTGHLLGASPRKQFVAQLVGIAAGVLVCVPIYLLVTSDGIGTRDLPAPSAQAWKATAELVAVGFDALPPYALWGVVAGLLFGMAVPLLKRFAPRTEPYLPSAMAFGIAFIIPAYFTTPFLLGALAHLVWRRAAPNAAAHLAFAVASGVLMGAGLASVVTAIFGAFKLEPWVPLPH